MGMDAQKWLQLSALLAQHAQMYTAANPGQNQFAQHLLGSAQSGIMAEALKKEKKKEEKKKKGAFGGSLGSALGAAGALAAPFTGGASLALTAGASALGGVAGQALAGGGFNPMDAAGYGASGLMSAATYGKSGPMGETVANGAEPVAPAPPPPAEVVANDVKNSVTKASSAVVPASNLNNPMPNATPYTSPAREKFGTRFKNAFNHVMSGPRYRVSRQPEGMPDIYYDR